MYCLYNINSIFHILLLDLTIFWIIFMELVFNFNRKTGSHTELADKAVVEFTVLLFKRSVVHL